MDRQEVDTEDIMDHHMDHHQEARVVDRMVDRMVVRMVDLVAHPEVDRTDICGS